MPRKNTSECIVFMASSNLNLPDQDVSLHLDLQEGYQANVVFLPDSKKWSWYCCHPTVFRLFGRPKLRPIIRMIEKLHEPKLVFVVHKKPVMSSSCAIASSFLSKGIVDPSNIRILLLDDACSDMEVANNCAKHSVPLGIVCDSRYDKTPYKEIERLFMHH
jgi:hypothetical protein